MKQIVSKYGWPTKNMVGADGTRAAWLLVQHADMDPVFQRQCLDRMTPHQKSRQVYLADVAYLTDRVHVNEGKPQIYGTQFHMVEGVRQPRPIRDPKHVDTRRLAMGLKTLKEYAEFLNS